MGKVTVPKKYAVSIEKLHWIYPPEIFKFECTTDIEPLKEFIGQERALDFINFGFASGHQGCEIITF